MEPARNARRKHLRNHADIILRWETDAAFAADIGVSCAAAYQMRRRVSIPPRHWPAVVAAARKRRLAVTRAGLAALMGKA